MHIEDYFDSHAHLSGDASYEQVEALLERAWEAGVRGVANICTDSETLRRGLELSKKYPWVYQTASTTPHDVAKEGAENFDFIATTARAGGLVAVGETGLDYFYAHSPQEIQQEFFRRYIDLSLETDLPLIIHCRDAFKDLYKILDEKYSKIRKERAGILHCFTGTLEEAKAGIERGWLVSFSGIVTFKKSVELKEVARELPLEKIVIETDTPYLAPQSHRGQPNEPAFMVETACCLAEIKGIDEAELVRATSRNARTLFGV